MFQLTLNSSLSSDSVPATILGFSSITLPSSFSRPPATLKYRYCCCRASRVRDLDQPASLYEVLRVSRDASATEIKTAYRSLAKLYHPDAASCHRQREEVDDDDDDQSDLGRDFIEINNAYETLSDPVARAVYDLSLGLPSRLTILTASSSSSGLQSERRRSGSGTYSSYSYRRWETDQCW